MSSLLVSTTLRNTVPFFSLNEIRITIPGGSPTQPPQASSTQAGTTPSITTVAGATMETTTVTIYTTGIIFYLSTDANGQVSTGTSIVGQTPRAATTSPVGLSASDRVALVTSLGIGIPALIATVLGAYYGYQAVKDKRRSI
jgi:hypothetical protein